VNLIPDKLQPYAKAVVAFIGGLATFVVTAIPALPDDWQKPLGGFLALATAAATYWIPNIEKLIDDDPVNETTAAEPDATDEPTDGTGVITDPGVENPSPDFTPDVDGADDLTAADDGTDVTHDGSVG